MSGVLLNHTGNLDVNNKHEDEFNICVMSNKEFILFSLGMSFEKAYSIDIIFWGYICFCFCLNPKEV